MGEAPTAGELAKKGEQVWYHFDVSEAGSYKIETELLTLDDSWIYLYENADEDYFAQNDDMASGNYASRVTRVLAPGRYYVRVTAFDESQTGRFNLTVVKQD